MREKKGKVETYKNWFFSRLILPADDFARRESEEVQSHVSLETLFKNPVFNKQA